MFAGHLHLIIIMLGARETKWEDMSLVPKELNNGRERLVSNYNTQYHNFQDKHT